MLKQIIPLLFSFIFSLNLFAESHDVHNDILDIKLQIQEIKLTDARDDKEKKIENLEEDIKKLEEKFNQNNIDKKDIEKSFDKNKEIIDRQDKRIEDIGTNLNYWGIGFSLIAIFTGMAVFLVNKNYADSAKKEAKAAAQQELKDWVDSKAEKEFEILIDNAKNEIREDSDKILKEIKDESLNKFDTFVESLERNNIKDKKWNYSELFKLVIHNYKENNINEALSYIEKAINCAESEKENIQALFTKALLFGDLRKLEEAIEVYDELIERFKDSKESSILEQVAKALRNKGLSFGETKEAIDVYDELIEKFKTSKESSILEQVAKAFVNKGVTLGKLGETKEAIEVYDELVKRFETSKENSILEKVATALHNKGATLVKSGKLEKAIEVYDELIEKFKTSKESSILDKVAAALLNKIETNLILGNISSKKDLYLYFNLIKENKEELLKFEMLKILEKAKDFTQDDEIKKWQIKFEDTKLGDWSFDELKTWAKTLENDAKERISSYIDIFENHNKNIEKK